MRRKIQFRGKRVDGEGWVFGFYYEQNGKSYICIEDHSDNVDSYYNNEVIPETVGQFWEKNGSEFYGGDLFYTEWSPDNRRNKKRKTLCVIEDAGDGIRVNLWLDGEWWNHVSANLIDIEIVGNIHDNPELLK